MQRAEVAAGDGEAVKPRVVAKWMLGWRSLCLLASIVRLCDKPSGKHKRPPDRVVQRRAMNARRREGGALLKPDVEFALRCKAHLEAQVARNDVKLGQGVGLGGPTSRLIAWLKPLQLIVFPRVMHVNDVRNPGCPLGLGQPNG